MARAMVINYGFSDIGPWSLMDQGAQSQDMIMRMMSRNSISESLQRKIDDSVKAIAAQAYEVALKHIRSVPLLCPRAHCSILLQVQGLLSHIFSHLVQWLVGLLMLWVLPPS